MRKRENRMGLLQMVLKTRYESFLGQHEYQKYTGVRVRQKLLPYKNDENIDHN